jgi:hypothetical protein
MKRSPGRPPLDDDEDSVPIHLTVTASTYDDLYRRAQREGLSVPETIRRTLRVDVPANELKNRK